MSVQRIVIRLDERIEFERDLAQAYRNVPRARRQEWVRSIIRAGLDASAHKGFASAAAPRVAFTQGAAVAPQAEPAQPAVAKPEKRHPQTPARQPEAAHVLRGFFGDQQATS